MSAAQYAVIAIAPLGSEMTVSIYRTKEGADIEAAERNAHRDHQWMFEVREVEEIEK